MRSGARFSRTDISLLLHDYLAFGAGNGDAHFEIIRQGFFGPDRCRNINSKTLVDEPAEGVCQNFGFPGHFRDENVHGPGRWEPVFSGRFWEGP